MADTIDVPLLDEVVWDGIVGLAYPNSKLTKEGVDPLFDNIIRQKLLVNNVFSYYLGINGGAVTFGGVDPRYFGDSDAKSPSRTSSGQKAPAKQTATVATHSGKPKPTVFLEKTSQIKNTFSYAKVTAQTY